MRLEITIVGVCLSADRTKLEGLPAQGHGMPIAGHQMPLTRGGISCTYAQEGNTCRLRYVRLVLSRLSPALEAALHYCDVGNL